VVVDPGTNLSTRRFSAQLTQAVAAQRFRADGPVTVESARPDDRQNLSIRGVFAELAAADVVICADSFTAHAAPLLKCTTLVLARSGLENWRVPHPRSFSFDGDRPLAETVGGMRQVLGHHGMLHPQDRQLPPLGAPEQALLAAGRELSELLGEGGDTEPACAAYARLAAARDAVVERLPKWPPDARALLRDDAYHVPLRRLDLGRLDVRGPRTANALLNHVEHSWLQWRNSNLHKYLTLALAAGGST